MTRLEQLEDDVNVAWMYYQIALHEDKSIDVKTAYADYLEKKQRLISFIQKQCPVKIQCRETINKAFKIKKKM